MSSPSSISNDSLSRSTRETDAHSDGRSRVGRSVKRPVQRVGFWTAVALPLGHVAILIHGLTGTTVAAAFVALLAANVLALYVGHGYNQ